jgi:hypothetical protein
MGSQWFNKFDNPIRIAFPVEHASQPVDRNWIIRRFLQSYVEFLDC